MDIEWIKKGLTKPGKSNSGLAKALGRAPSAVTALLNGGRQIKASEVAIIARYLDIEAPLAGARFDLLPDQTAIQHIPVRGIAQAGSWRAYEDMDYSSLPPVPTVPGRYAASEQFALKIAGNSVNKLRIFDGDFVICVNYWIARTGPVDGDIVAVERRRGPEFERTVKRLKIVDGGFELHPESDDPRHKPIFVKKNHGFHEGEGIEIEIIGLVIGRWSPM